MEWDKVFSTQFSTEGYNPQILDPDALQVTEKARFKSSTLYLLTLGLPKQP